MNKQSSFQNAVKWAYTASWGEKGLSALFLFVMAAVLGPHDFGTISIAVIYIAFLQMFLDQGLALALIQIRHLEPEHLDTVFWFDMGLSGFLVGASLLLRNQVAKFNHAPDAGIIIAALTPCILIEAAAIVPMSLLRRSMDFKSISIRTNVSTLVGGLVGIALVFSGFRLWALVAQQLIRDTVAVILLWKLSSWRPRWEYSWAHFRQLLPFSAANFLAQLGVFGDGQGAALLLGAMFGPTAVGIYRLGERITNSVITMSMASIQSAALPEFARLQDKPVELRQTALHCVRLSGAVTAPTLAALATVGFSLMTFIGPSWVPAVNVLRVLSLAGIIMLFSFYTGPFLQGTGRAREAAVLEWGRVIIGLGALFIAGWFVRNDSTEHQVLGIAFSRLIVGAVVVTPAFIIILIKMCKIDVRDFVIACLPSIFAATCIGIAVPLVNVALHLRALSPLKQLAIQSVFGAAVGLCVLFALDDQLRRSLGAQLRRFRTPANVNA